MNRFDPFYMVKSPNVGSTWESYHFPTAEKAVCAAMSSDITCPMGRSITVYRKGWGVDSESKMVGIYSGVQGWTTLKEELQEAHDAVTAGT